MSSGEPSDSSLTFGFETQALFDRHVQLMDLCRSFLLDFRKRDSFFRRHVRGNQIVDQSS